VSNTAVSGTGPQRQLNAEGFPVFARTNEGAHLRLDHHEMVIGELRDLFGEAPDPIAGVPGRGVMGYLHRSEAELQRTRILQEHQAANNEKWKWRWTLIGTVATICAGVLTALHTVQELRQPVPAPAVAAPRAR